MLLEVKHLEVGYGKRPVVYDISVTVGKGEIVGMIGHNAAGKTTTLKGIVGLLKPSRGEVAYGGYPITGRSPEVNASDGLVFLPQEKAVFTDLTVRENLEIGLYTVHDKADAESRLKLAHGLFPVLKEREQQKAKALSGGEQRMLSLAVALMLKPRLLLLDEPSLGLSPKMVERMMDAIREIQHTLGTGIIVTEQNVKQVLQIAERVYVMKMGRIVLEGRGKELLEQHQWWDLF